MFSADLITDFYNSYRDTLVNAFMPFVQSYAGELMEKLTDPFFRKVPKAEIIV